MADGTIIIDTKINTDGVEAGADKIKTATERAAKNVKKIGERTANVFKGDQYETPEFLKINKDLDKVMDKFGALDYKKRKFLELGGSQKSKQWQSMEYDADRLSEQYQILLEKKEKLLSSGKAYTTEKTSSGSGDNAVVAIKSTARSAFLLLRVAGLIVDKIKKKINWVINSTKKMFTIAIKSISVASKAFGRFIASVSKGLSNIAAGLVLAVGQILGILGKIVSFIGSTFIKAIKYAFNFIKSNAKISFDTMAAQIDSVNKDLSTLVTAINQVKASIATMFQPLLTVAVPIFKSAINIIVSGMNTLGELIAELTGQGYIYEAIAQQEDYAESLENTAKTAKKATANLSGLDQIHQWTSDNDSGNDSSGNNSVIPGVTYTKKQVTKSVKNFAQLIKTAWENSDFTAIGEGLAEKLNTSLKKIKWNKIKTTAEKIGASIGTFINGAFRNLDFAETIGNALGESINTVVSGVKSFVSITDFSQIGEFVGTLFTEGFKAVDWKSLGQTIGETVNGALELINGFLGQTDFLLVGQSIGNMVRNAFNSIKWETLGSDIGNGANGAVDVLKGFFDTTKYAETGTNIANVITDSFEAIDWGRLGNTIGKAINSASSLIIGFIRTFNIASIVASLSSLIKNVFSETKWYNLGFSIGSTIKTVIDLFVGTIDALWQNKEKIMTSIADLIKGSFDGLNYLTLGTEIGNGINKLFELFTGLLDTIKQEKVSAKIRKVLSDAIRTVDWKTVGQDVADAVNTLLEIIPFDDIVDALSEFVSGLLQSIDWQRLIYAVFMASEGIKNGIIKGIVAAVSGDTTTKTHIKPWVSSGGTVPKLASGAVIPPNAPFMAFLGDQNNGTNLEAPESLIRKIVREESGNGSYTFVAQLDGETIFRKVVSTAETKKKNNGINPLLLGGR